MSFGPPRRLEQRGLDLTSDLMCLDRENNAAHSFLWGAVGRCLAASVERIGSAA
jgi:hypothetical protein